MRRWVFQILPWCGLCLLLFTPLLLQGIRFQNSSGQLRVHMLNVGQGDSALLQGPRKQNIIIDGGPDLSMLTAMAPLLSFFDRRIDLLILSHQNSDHLWALPELLRRYEVTTLLLPRDRERLPRVTELLTLARERGVRIIEADSNLTLDLGGGLTIDVLSPPKAFIINTNSDVNDASAVVAVRFHKNCILFTGDMEERTERLLVQRKVDLQCPVLKVAHHGSITSSSTEFLRAVHPAISLVSVGAENPYGHPSPRILERLSSLGSIVRSTARCGTITVTVLQDSSTPYIETSDRECQ